MTLNLSIPKAPSSSQLVWYVYVGDFNSGRIERHNVFDHVRVMDDLKKAARKYRDSERELFDEELRRDLMYYYWSKCEWEVVVDHWPPASEHVSDKYRPEKVDVYEQVMMNWHVFEPYVWSKRSVLRRREKDNRADSPEQIPTA